MIAVGMSSIIALSVYLTQVVMVQNREVDATSAVSSLRASGLSLFDFESEYGRFPDNITAAEIQQKTGTMITLSDRTSNDVFVQLIAAGLAEERRFDTYSKSAGPRTEFAIRMPRRWRTAKPVSPTFPDFRPTTTRPSRLPSGR
jgi:hypothetical protein